MNKKWWARKDSNLGPRDYESPALTAELRARSGLKENLLRLLSELFFPKSSQPRGTFYRTQECAQVSAMTE
jgi:hypothetical protein